MSNRRTKINMEQGGFTSVCDTALVDARKGRGKKSPEYLRRVVVRAPAETGVKEWRRLERGEVARPRSVFCGEGWVEEERGGLGVWMKRAAYARPGDFFLPRELPVGLVPLGDWDGERWVVFFVKAGWPEAVARVWAGAVVELGAGAGAAAPGAVVREVRKSRRGKVRPVNGERKERALVVLRGLERWGTSAEVGERLGVCHREAARLLGALKREGRVGLQHRRRWSPVEGA